VEGGDSLSDEAARGGWRPTQRWVAMEGHNWVRRPAGDAGWRAVPTGHGRAVGRRSRAVAVGGRGSRWVGVVGRGRAAPVGGRARVRRAAGDGGAGDSSRRVAAGEERVWHGGRARAGWESEKIYYFGRPNYKTTRNYTYARRLAYVRWLCP
jgi:hypothetical protein